MSGVIDFNEFINSDNPVLVDFYASWCSPCKMIAPFVDELHAEGYGVVKLDIDEHEELVKEHKVMGVPTLLVFKNGEVVDKHTGFAPKVMIQSMLDKHK